MKRWKQRIIIFKQGEESEVLEDKPRTEPGDDDPAGNWVMKEETLGLGDQKIRRRYGGLDRGVRLIFLLKRRPFIKN